MELVKFNIGKPTPENIWEVYSKCCASIELYFDPVQNPNYEEKFAGLSQEEVDNKHRDLLEEISLRSSFYLLAYIESLFRTDFILRLESGNNKGKDLLTKEYKKIWNPAARLYSYSLKDDIFENWKRFVYGKPNYKELLDILNTLPQYFDFRNWMAHGRYWLPKETNYRSRYNYVQVQILLGKIEQNFGGLLKKKNFGIELE